MANKTKHSHRKKVVIYQMGKVASSSIRASLEDIKELDVTHTHHLSSSYTRELNDLKSSKGWQVTITPESIKKLWSEIIAEDELKIISLVREPVGRNISAYFENLDVIHGQKNAHDQLSYDQLRDGFLQKYPHSIPVTWFDKEVKQSLGIDVYKYDFPKKVGALFIHEGKCDLLLMRHDLDDAVKKKYIEELLGTEPIRIKRVNIGTEKSYKNVYKNFIDNVRLPDTYLTEMLDSNYARHFFDQSELAFLKQRWGS